MWRLPAQMTFATKKKTTGAKHFRRACDKKINVLALAAVLSVPDEALPPEVAAGLGQLMTGLLKLLIGLRAQQVPSQKCQVSLQSVVGQRLDHCTGMGACCKCTGLCMRVTHPCD
jgi:hypothetical protein